MVYAEALQYLDSFLNYEQRTDYVYPRDFSLERVQTLLARLGDPQEGFLSFHIAGTKGKGSTAAFAASLLGAAGLKVGLYTSPHLKEVRERIQVSGVPIPEEALADLIFRIRPQVPAGLTYFELLTACAFLHFARQRVDVAVLEVGLGGRLDATNLVSPEVTAMTPVSLDHMQQLGHTLGAIVREKAGILKAGVPLVLAPQPPEALAVLEGMTLEKGVACHRIDREVRWEVHALSLQGSQVSITTPEATYRNLNVPLLGGHQVLNAATAIRMVECFDRRAIPEAVVRQGIGKTRWPGRCQWVPGRPPILLDGAHNAASAGALRQTVERWFPGRKIWLLVGVSLGKDLAGMAQVWGPWAHRVWVTQAAVPRAESPDRLSEHFRAAGGEVVFAPSVDRALSEIRQVAASEDLVVVTGSLFVVAEALEALEDKQLDTSTNGVSSAAGLKTEFPRGSLR